MLRAALIDVGARHMMDRHALSVRRGVEGCVDEPLVIVVVVEVKVINPEAHVIRDPLVEVSLLELHVGHDACGIGPFSVHATNPKNRCILAFVGRMMASGI